MKVKATIYVIKCPDTLNVVYVGVTAYFEGRVCMHKTSKSTNSPIGRWIKHLKTLNKEPIFETYKKCKYERRWQVEGDVIYSFLKSGTLLLNSHQNTSIHRAVSHYLPHETI